MRPTLRSLITVVALIAVGACSDQAPLNAPLPPGGTLVGRFGGRLLEITATDTSAHFRFACWSGDATPIRVSIEGVLEASGTVQLAGIVGTEQPLYATAQLRGNVLDVTATIGSSASAYRLWRNVPGDFFGVGCPG